MSDTKTISDDVSDTHTDITKATVDSEVLSTPPSSVHSRPPSTLPEPDENIVAQDPDSPANAQKKKKKKKGKKSAAKKAADSNGAAKAVESPDEDRPPVLCISRNKHWRYISSYHVRTLQSFIYPCFTLCPSTGSMASTPFGVARIPPNLKFGSCYPIRDRESSPTPPISHVKWSPCSS